jgi:hypothetical protein
MQDNLKGRALENPETAAIVQDIFESILGIFGAINDTIPIRQKRSDADPKPSLEKALFAQESAVNKWFQEPVSKRHRFSWAVTNKTKVSSQVIQFGTLVHKLHLVIPPDTSSQDYSQLLAERLRQIQGKSK